MSYQRLSDQQVSPRLTLVFGMSRLLMALIGLVGLALWLVSAGSPSLATKIFGDDLGKTIGNVSGTTEVLVAGAILVGIGVLFYMSRTLFGRLLILVVLAVVAGLAFFLPNPVGLVPATMLLLILGGLTALFVILTSVVS